MFSSALSHICTVGAAVGTQAAVGTHCFPESAIDVVVQQLKEDSTMKMG